MKFRTEIQLSPRQPQISHQTGIVCMGSCFAESMGKRLEAAKFNATTNPLGIVYNPVSLAHHLGKVAAHGVLSEATKHPQLDYWHSFDLHSSFHAETRELFEQRLNKSILQTKNALKDAKVLILTLGTAWVYKNKESGRVVANCHKYPSSFFTRELIHIKLTSLALGGILQVIRKTNPEFQVIMTVSPIRHIKDGLEENAISKATLRLICQKLSAFPYIHYFPAYEIMMDDLRDYRFYENDLIHPTTFAEDYIWQHFTQTHLAPESQKLLHRWQQIQKELAHRPLRPDSEQYRQFLKKLLAKLNDINSQLNCSEEIAQIQERLM